MRFHKTNNISQNFSGITFDFREILKYFVVFRFQFFQKMTAKFRFLLNRFEISKFSDFLMVKVKKVNIAITYSQIWTF